MWHVYPTKDEREHVIEGTSCWCEPRILWNDPETGEILVEGIAVHHAADCREVVEEAERLMQMWSETE